MRQQTLTQSFFSQNRKKLMNDLIDGDLVVVFSNPSLFRNGDQPFPFRQSSEMFYLTGIVQDDSVLTMSLLDGVFQEVLYIREADEKKVVWDGHQMGFDEASEISGIQEIRSNEKLLSDLQHIAPKSKSLILSYNKFDVHARRIIDFIAGDACGRVKELDNVLSKYRMIKEPAEVEIIRKSIEVTHQAFLGASKIVRPGTIEYEVEAELTKRFLASGADAHAFEPIVASGVNSCTLHYIQNNREMKSGDMLLLDFGSELNGYAADVSRTIPVNGKYTARQKEVYQAVLDVQKKAIGVMVSGTTIKEINQQARGWLEEKMIDLGLFKQSDFDHQDENNPISKKYFMHGTSHFMGLDVHDTGSSDTVLRPGMVLTCEPGLYIRDEEIGIRIENDILIGENDPVDLTGCIEREVGDIEELMGK